MKTLKDMKTLKVTPTMNELLQEPMMILNGGKTEESKRLDKSLIEALNPDRHLSAEDYLSYMDQIENG